MMKATVNVGLTPDTLFLAAPAKGFGVHAKSPWPWATDQPEGWTRPAVRWRRFVKG